MSDEQKRYFFSVLQEYSDRSFITGVAPSNFVVRGNYTFQIDYE
jgi:hypothetical protein